MIGENMQSCTHGNFRRVLLISNLHKTHLHSTGLAWSRYRVQLVYCGHILLLPHFL